MKGTEEQVKNVQENNTNNNVKLYKSSKTVHQNTTGQKQAKKTVVVKTIKQGAGLVSRSGDFIGRLGTLMVMIVASINTGTIMVTSFLEGVYWKGVVFAVLMVFIHLPMIVVMIWFMCKAKVQSIFNKVRPSRPGEAIAVTEVENETIVYEETVEVQEDAKEKNGDEKIDNKNVREKVSAAKMEAERKNQLRTEEMLKKRVAAGEQVTTAIGMF